MRSSLTWLAVLSSLATLSLAGAASAQELATHSLTDTGPSADAPASAYAAPAAARPAFTNPKPPSEVKVSKKSGQSWTCQVAYDDGFAFCSVKFTDADGRRMQYPNTVRFYDLYGRMLAGPPATYAKYVPSARPQADVMRASLQSDGAHDEVSGGLEHAPDHEMIVTKSADGNRVYAASYNKPQPILGPVLALGLLDIVHGVSERIAFGNYGYYGGGYTPRTNWYNPSDRCSMGPGYTGPIVPCR